MSLEMLEKIIVEYAMRWRRIGALKYLGDFAALEEREGKQFIQVYNNAYQVYMRTGSSGALKDFNNISEKVMESIMKLPEHDRDICVREYYKRVLAVTYRDRDSQLTLEAIIDAVKSRPEFKRLVSERVLHLEEVEAIQAIASGIVADMVKDEYLHAYTLFSNRLPPDHPELFEQFKDIVLHFSKWGKNESIKSGYINRLKGALFEKYAANSRIWQDKVKDLFMEAQKEAKKIGGNWEAERIVGGLNLFYKNAWDEVLLIRNEELGKGYLFSAAQFKAEKRLTALDQIHRDIWREMDALSRSGNSGMPNILKIVDQDNKIRAYQLIPPLRDTPTYRYVVSTAGVKVPLKDEAELIRDGIRVDMLELDLTANDMKGIAEGFYEAVAMLLNL